MRTKNYSDYLTRVSGLIGIPADTFNASELTMLNGYFQTNLDDAWQRTNWIDLCPYGEARFVGNKLTYPNDLSKTANWTATAVTVTPNSVPNPADGRTTASKVLETSATSAHSVSQSVDFIGSTTYQIFGYARYLGRNFIKATISDGSSSFSAFFNIQAGSVGTTSGTTSASISQQSDGFWVWSVTFTTSTSASTGSVTLQSSTDGATTSFAGDATKGFYSWGNLLLQTGTPGVENSLVAWAQLGEEIIEAVFEVWRNGPQSFSPACRLPYEITPNGIQMLVPDGSWAGMFYSPPVTATTVYANLPPNPVYLYYRKQAPDFSGDDYDATVMYAVGDQIFFTEASGAQNYYKCLIATSAGQSPTTTAASWSILSIPDFIFRFIVFGAYADWLRQDGQFEKAQAADQNAEGQIEQEFDRQERQMGWVQPIRVQTHLSSRTTY